MKKAERVCDLLVIGSGAAGLTAAITAASKGFKVIVLEKSDYVGGATAWSGGWIWLPKSAHKTRQTVRSDTEQAEHYLKHVLGSDADQAKIKAYLDSAPALEELLLEHTPVRFQQDVSIPDYYATAAGYSESGRSRVVAPMKGHMLGDDIQRLRKPMPHLTIAGLMPSAGPEMRHFFNAGRSFRSSLYVFRRLLRHGIEWLTTGRSLTLTNGNALAGGLFKAALDLGVEVMTGMQARSLIWENEKVSGATIDIGLKTVKIYASNGVVLACGGFPANTYRRKQFYHHTRSGEEHWSVAPSVCNGDGLTLGEAVGAKVDGFGGNGGAWVPVSMVPQPNGHVAPFPHFADRAKPGLIAVRKDGKRFTNEAAPYFQFMQSLFKATKPNEDPVAWLICDHAFQRRYGLGFSKPSPIPIRKYLSSGYLVSGQTLHELAEKCGINTEAFCRTVSRYNKAASRGHDPMFRRGSEPVNRAQGDPSIKPNPCVSPLLKPPYYAVKILPGCLGSFAGLKTDAKARVLDQSDSPISGLFACGSDMASMMSGHYPAGGISLGPALVFGYLAGCSSSGGVSSNDKTSNIKKDFHAYL
ncbi:MAG: FAD-dependent oxidoreductase [Sneathiella sp.]